MNFKTRLTIIFIGLILSLILGGCRSITSNPNSTTCHLYATREMNRIVATPPHELRCSGGGAEADHVQFQAWAYNNAYNECMNGEAK